jgi:hypothetical protein
MSNSSFFSTSGATSNQTDAIEASVNNAATSEAAALASKDTATAQATISTDKATESAASAAEALVSKNAAAGSNTAATNSKNAAATSASAASSSASSASSSASTASTKASQASSSQSASSSSASTASTKASEASTSAASSLTAKNASVVAQAASEAARDASVVAKNASVVAQGASETAETNSETARDASIAAKDTSTTKANESAASAAAALVSKNSATASASTATTKANEASASATTSTASKNTAVAVTANFLGAHSSAPTATASGGSLAVGMLYFDTGSDVLKVRASGGWINAGSSINGTSARFAYTLSANQTTVSGNDLSGNSLQFDAPFCDVFLNGAKLAAGDINISSGTSVVLAAGATAGDILEVVAFGTFQLSNGTFAGTTTVNNLTITGTTTAPTQAESDDSTKIATTAYVVDKITTLIGGAPSTLNDLNELAAAINDDSAYNSTLVTALATKMPKSGGAFTGAVTTNSTFDGVDIATRDAVLTSTTTVANAALPKSGGTMTGALNVGGTVTADGLTMDTAANSAYTMELGANRTSAGQALGIIRGSWDDTVVAQINIAAGDDTTNKDNGRIFLRTASAGSTANRVQVAENGDISFYEDTGSTAKFFWDASAESLGIGNSIPSSFSIGNLVVGSGSGAEGITIYSGNDSEGILRFADGASGAEQYQGQIKYHHNGNYLRFYTSTVERMRIDSLGNMGLNTDGTLQNSSGFGTLTLNGSTGGQVAFYTGNVGKQYIYSSSTDLNIYNAVAGNLKFWTNATERMSISSVGHIKFPSGNLSGYSQTSGVGGTALYADNGTSGGSLIQVTNSARGWANFYVNRIWSAGADYRIMQFTINGSGVAGGVNIASASTISFATSSDYRLKENVVYDWDATTRLKQLKPARFNFILDGTDVTQDGFMAHEAQGVVPIAVSGTKDAMKDEEYEVTPAVLDDDGVETEAAVMGTRSVINAQSIDHSKLVPLLVKTIQELEARITALEAN